MRVKHKGKKPSLEYQLAYACVQHSLPDHSPEDWKARVDKRWQGRKPPVNTVIEADDIAAAAEEFGSDDENVQAVLEEIVEAKTTGKPRAKTAAAKRAAAKPNAKPVPFDVALTADSHKKYLPPHRRCALVKDDSFHFRWKASYPRDPNDPSSLLTWVTQAFSVSSDADALSYVLRGVWALHI
eukprot:TRINITY_DN54434_c0_g1_i1.p1 TRINITY_DN54434_c0_g1~~TRINITY_DN54434_c0_g1_i1.p1  ORF type:complete len:183 (-),score=21.85 TRINITY_DN54434_c0_g1_i1:115-663(-)